MKKKTIILMFFMIMSLFVSASDMVRVVYGGYVGQSEKDILKFRHPYTTRIEKEVLLKNGNVFYLQEGTLLEKKQEIYGHYEEFLYQGKIIYAVNLLTRNVQNN